MNKKILALDIDGTLVNSRKEMTQETVISLKRMMEAGHILILASGRPTGGMMRYSRELELEKFDGYILSYNGARVLKGSEVIIEKPLPPQIPAQLYEYAGEHDAGIVTFEGEYSISGFEPNKYVLRQAKNNLFDIKAVPNFPEYVNFPVYKCMIMDDPEKIAEYEKELQEKYGDSLSVYRSEDYFLEIMNAGINKADTLARIMKIIGTGPENLICAGDGFNDISMIKYAGTGVAMGNAKDCVKAEADCIAPSCDEDGIVWIVDNLVM